MWTSSIMTILFRGLMVMHRIETRTGSYMEIGVLPAPHHTLRINTIKNSVISSTFLLQHNADSDNDKVNPARPFWRLVIDNPIGGGVSSTIRDHFDREQDHGSDDDFRWIVDLESEQMFGTLGNKVDTDILLPIMVIPNGIFYTRLKSPPLTLSREGEAEPFGCLCSVVGCDIPILEGRVRLVERSTGELIFDFKREANTIYEIVNTPPCIEVHEPDHHCPDHSNDSDRGHEHDQSLLSPPDPCEHDHFQHYYKMFKVQMTKICFHESEPHPAPDPFLCGIVMLGQRKEPLRQ